MTNKLSGRNTSEGRDADSVAVVPEPSLVVPSTDLVVRLRNLMVGAKKLYEHEPNKGDMWFFELYHNLKEAADSLDEESYALRDFRNRAERFEAALSLARASLPLVWNAGREAAAGAADMRAQLWRNAKDGLCIMPLEEECEDIAEFIRNLPNPYGEGEKP